MAPDPPGLRAPFVGRETQFGALLAAVQAAEFGEPVLALVAGEPGIGKTRLVAEVTGRVSARVLWATCWEGDGAPAYWPWLQLVRDLTADGDAGVGGAADLLQGSPASEPGMDGRFQLFDTVGDRFASASRARPLVLVLDDLHWADEASIRLLQFLVRDRRPRRLAIIGTYRDTDLDPGHPLAVRLAELVRDGLHVSLGGLGRRDVSGLVDAVRGTYTELTGADLTRTVALLHRLSGGNPFFLWELLQLLRSEGGLAGRHPAGRAGVPTGVRAVVARRISKLSSGTGEVLAAAAVLGSEFAPAVLGPVTGGTGEELLDALHEAELAGLVVQVADGGFRFVHALVREVLYERLTPGSRAGLHRAVAAALEARYGDTRPAELAHHVLEGAAVDDATGAADDRGVGYAVRAAEHSLQLLAYEDAAHWYSRALDVLRARRPGDAREGGLLLACGETRLAAGVLPGAREVYQQAAAIARRAGDAEQLARAALGLGAGLGGFEVQLFDPVQVDLLEEALRALGPKPSPLRAWVLARLSVALSFMAAEDRRRAMSEEAIAVGREVGDHSALGYALAAHCDTIAGPDGCEPRLAESAEIVRLGLQTGDRQLELLGRRLRLVALLEVGDIGGADDELERYALVAEALRQPLYLWYVPLWRGMRALMRGDLGEAAQCCAKAEEIGARANSGNAVALTFTQWWVRRRYEGRFVEAGTAMVELLGQESATSLLTASPRAVMATQMGERDKALALLQQWLAADAPERTRGSEWLPESAQLAEAAFTVGAREAAEALYARLRPYAHLFCVEGIGAAFTGSVAWYLALLARFLGRTAEAQAYLAQAREAHRRTGLVGDPPPLAQETGPPPGPVARADADGAASMRWEGATWAIRYAGKSCRLRDSKGLRDLAILLSRPGQEVHCLELAGGADVGSPAGPALDQAARRAYEQRIRDLQEDIDEARSFGDPVRAERAEAELDALVQQLAEAFGLSGRARATGSAAERARSAVTWRIRAALRHTAEVHPELARHLQNAVRTGTWCSYRPESAVAWEIDAGQGRSE